MYTKKFHQRLRKRERVTKQYQKRNTRGQKFGSRDKFCQRVKKVVRRCSKIGQK